MSDRWSTHDVRVEGHEVVKRYRKWDGAQHVREWRALRLLDSRAPGLAPAPLRALLDTRPPSVAMSRVPGEPLRGKTVTAQQTKALAVAVRELHEALPAQVAAALPPRAASQDEVTALIGRWNAHRSPAAADPVVARVLDDGMAWLATGPFEGVRGPGGHAPVLGHGDGNLANYLWDGSRVRIVDFEDAGRSDRAFELAEITEHASTWVDTRFDVDLFLTHCAPTARERERLPAADRALLALPAVVRGSATAAQSPGHPAAAGRPADGSAGGRRLRRRRILDGIPTGRHDVNNPVRGATTDTFRPPCPGRPAARAGRVAGLARPRRIW